MARRTTVRTAVPAWIPPMLAKPDGGRLPSGPQWSYEIKWDGYRAAMRVAPDGTTVLTSRGGLDFTAEFASLADVLTPALHGQAAVLDGEIVVYNQAGQVDFGLLQERRGRWRKHAGAARARGAQLEDVPVRFLAFDLLQLGDTVLLDQPYQRRRQMLTELPMPDPHRVAVAQAHTFDELAADRITPQALLDRVARDGGEGLVVKQISAPYAPGRRTDAWLKHALVQTQEVIVCGFRPGQNRLAGTVGGLLLGAHDPGTGDLVYIGDVGTGFTERARRELGERLEPLERNSHPFAAAPPREDVARARWVRPELVGEVVYRQFTRGAGRLRHTAWRGLREDRDPADVLVPQPGGRAPDPAPGPRGGPPPKRQLVQAGGRQITLSNLDKPLYPTGFTKAQVLDYYARIAPVLLPHLAGRPVTVIRYPDGVEGQKFFEKNIPRGAPDWMPTARLSSRGSRRASADWDGVIEYPLVDELAGLMWLANLAALEFHVPQWRVAPGGVRGLSDRLVFDLDPGPGTTIVACCRVAERLREILLADGLTPVATTSGSKGMQIYSSVDVDDPLAPSAYAKILAQQLAWQTPGTVTATMAKAAREGKVFVDWSQNNPSKTTISPYSLRGRDLPTVATPVTWDEVAACRRASQLAFTSAEVLDRVDELGDLLADLEQTAALPQR